MPDRENVREESSNSVKEVVKKLIHHKFNERDVMECVIEAMFIGIVETIPENERLQYLSKHQYVLQEFQSYIDIDNILSETIKTPNGLYTPEMLDDVLNIKINMKRHERYFIF